MALTKAKKTSVIDETKELLDSSKMTVLAKYQGIEVKEFQTLRRDAKENGTRLKVIKNRLVKQALKQSDKLKDIDTSPLEGMILYAFNDSDEVAAAQALNNFAKKNPNLVFVGAINEQGEFLDADSVKSLASLPGKNQLIAGVINTLNSPIRSATSGLNNLSYVIKGLEAKASN
ncbi:MAG TPA: 50S ribosomal protein L10 [Candidatus Sulfotelmatobacter sp.]|nr:50S ribosomal protein L10 [Candidatus Sulfotelmatobacter sp.]